MKRKLVVTTLLLCLTMSVAGCGKKDADVPANAPVQEETKVPVQTAPVTKETIENKYTYSGKAEAVDDANVFSLIQGKVAKVNFDVGDWVNKGDVLFQMDTADYVNQINVLKASLTATEANIKSARTSVELVNGASYQTQVESARSAVQNAETGVQNAELGVQNAEIAFNNIKTTYDNNKVLFESGIVSKTEMDATQMNYDKAQVAYEQAKTTLEQAKTAYDQAQKNYNLVANEMPEENLRKAQDALDIALSSKNSINAQITSAQKSINDATVTSPISGMITSRGVTAGTVLSQSAPAFTIIDTSRVNINVKVSEQIINSLVVGQSVDVKISAASNEPFKGTISIINPAADSAGTYSVQVEIPNPDGVLKAGMFGEVSFVKERKENVIVVERDTVLSKNGEDFVYVIEDGVAKQIPVTVGIDNGNKVEITSGLEEGTIVAVKGQNYLSDGDKVEIVSDLEETMEENNEQQNIEGQNTDEQNANEQNPDTQNSEQQDSNVQKGE